jgi:lysozyme family protein
MNEKLLKNTVIGKDFLLAIEKNQEQPSIDSFLDYRSLVLKAIKNKRTITRCWLNREIEAIDEIITQLQILNK